MSAIHGVGAAAAAAMQQVQNAVPAQGTASSSAAGQVPFAGVFQSMVAETSGLEQKANDAITGLMNGSGVELHDAMIATQKADMSFELALQVRNKAVAAYQQMMGMQF
jgi:flagellar hook-basal body complex protein FliE